MQTLAAEIIEVKEGSTRFLVPKNTVTGVIPSKEPAFFNPKAKLNRDFSIIVYSTYLKNFNGPKIFLDGLSGLGARGLRVANEINKVEKVVINDLNSNALKLAEKSAKLNNLKNFEVSENEVCRFLGFYSKKGNRGTIVDIDPFGSPSKYLDCGIRATMHGGLFSTTATDLQVLHGLFNKACKRRYGGIPIKTKYGNEIAIRLILGCVWAIAARFDIEINPIFVETDFHYHRTYVKIFNRPDPHEKIGYIFHCNLCGHRGITKVRNDLCELCNSKLQIAGPLWIGKLFDKKFIESMLEESSKLILDKSCEKILQKCLSESEMPGTYFTLDEIASKMKISPKKLEAVISKLKDNGYLASRTSFDPTGFRTNANIDEISKNIV